MQRTVALGGSAFLALLLMGTFMFASRPQYQLLYNNVDQPSRVKIADALRNEGIDFRFEGSSLFVPSNKAEDAEMAVGRAGATPTGQPPTTGLDQINPMSPPAVEQQRIIQDKEQRLASSIRSIAGIRNATVILSMPERRAFVGESSPAGASVTIDTGGLILAPSTPRAIANMLLTSVSGLTVDHISINDTSGSVVFDGSVESQSSSAAERNLAIQRAEAARIQEQLRSFLAGQYGAENILVSVRAELDLDTLETNEEIQEATKTPVEETNVNENMQKNGGAVGTSPTQSNTATATPATAADQKGESYKGGNKNIVRPISKKTIVTSKAVGKLTKLAISVGADATKFADPAMQDNLRQTVDSFIAERRNDTTNFPTPTITWVPGMAEPKQKAAQQAMASVQSQARMQQILSAMPIVMIALLGLMVMKSLSKAAKATPILIKGIDGKLEAIDPAALAAHGLSLPQGPQEMHHHNGPHALPEDASFLPHGDPNAVHLVPGGQQIQMVDEYGEPVQISQIKDVIHVPLEQIKRMAQEKPNVVAILIKSWLLEERK